MKKLLLLIAIFCVLETNAQVYLISFAGTGASSTVGSVKVENLTAATSLTLSGSNVLRLNILTGIDPVKNTQLSGLKIYPNPATDNSVLQIYPPVEGNADIKVFDMTGKEVAQMRSYLENSLQEFRLSGLQKGFYMISVTGNSYSLSGKLISNARSSGKISMEKISNNLAAEDKTLKNTISKGVQDYIDMPYSIGDRIKFTGISGNFSTVKTDIPAGDKTITFNFISCTDGDNINYPVVEIGNQVWMAENLKTTKYRNGDLIGTTTPATLNIYSEITPKYQWAFNGNETNASIYGRLYTWDLVTDNRNLCPLGWHVPSDAEWNAMTNFLGGSGYSGAGSKIKETGIINWATSLTGGTNESGFTALPGGYRTATNGFFTSLSSVSIWWTSFGNNANAKTFQLSNYPGNVVIAYEDKASGFSIRCLRGEGFVLPLVITTAVTSITQTTASGGGNILNDGGAPVKARGVCWSIGSNPVVSASHSINGTGTGVFSSAIDGLAGNTLYYVRAYATNQAGTSYGNEVTFTTPPSIKATLTTTTASSITAITASSGGNISNSGGETITERGVCWSTSASPDLSGSHSSDGTGTGTFESSIDGLTANTTYYIRAYATNKIGTSYGNELSFTTTPKTIPVLKTTGSSSVTQTTAVIGGNIINDGGAPIIARGICWSESPNPTIADNYTSDGTGSGMFVSNLSGLISNTKYYIRAYAINIIGTSYGNEVIVKTFTGTVTDIDGNVYNTVTIGRQVWMAENLKTTKYNDNTPIPLGWGDWMRSTPAYCWYNNDEQTFKNPNGALYNWYTVETGNLCPDGWIVPADTAWTTLFNYLADNGYGYQGYGGIGKSLASQSGWASTSTAGTVGNDQTSNNSSGFTALPAGYRDTFSTYQDITWSGNWWISNVNYTYVWTYYFNLNCSNSNIGKLNNNKAFGASIRCIKN